ncbi:MAG: Hypothetical protein AJITA_00885 [Acetilactobacillus jinshanensis]
MLYNKNQFRKTNDKKVLHKIGKHWVTVSIAMLAMIGLAGAIIITKDYNNNNNYIVFNTKNVTNMSLRETINYKITLIIMDYWYYYVDSYITKRLSDNGTQVGSLPSGYKVAIMT